MPSGDWRFVRVQGLIYHILCSVGCGLRLGVPDAGVSAGRCVFPPAGAGGRPDPPAFGSSCGRKEKAVGRAVRFEGFRSVADLVRLRTVPGRHGRRSVRQADRRRPIRRERTKRLCRDTAIWGDVWTGSPRYRLFARRLCIQPKERTPGICGHVSKDDRFGHGRPHGGIPTDRVAPDMRVGESRPRRSAFLSFRRNGGFEGRYAVACKPAGGPLEGTGGNPVRYDPPITELPAPFRIFRKVRRQSGYGVGRVRGNGRSADPIPVIFPSRSGRSRRRHGLLRCN